MKVLALYLPQYHRIPENDMWWGEGFTEWVTVKNAKQFYSKHDQPRRPLNNNYYDLDIHGEATWRWQADLMKQYKVYGICIYHYWFNGKMLLNKPMEILLQHNDIDINYCICWANETWARTWDGREKDVLQAQTYGGDDDNVKHFDYLLQFFKDERYIKIDNKPVVNLYKSKNIPNLEEMINIWNKLAKKNGFEGIYWVSAVTSGINDDRDNLFDHYYYFEPGYTIKHDLPAFFRVFYLARTTWRLFLNSCCHTSIVERTINTELIWRQIEKRKESLKISPGTFVGWDNTPRKKEKGTVFKNYSPARFGINISKLNKKYPNDEFLYINAWNEWGEGAFLEPDETFRYESLEAIKKAVCEDEAQAY